MEVKNTILIAQHKASLLGSYYTVGVGGWWVVGESCISIWKSVLGLLVEFSELGNDTLVRYVLYSI